MTRHYFPRTSQPIVVSDDDASSNASQSTVSSSTTRTTTTRTSTASTRTSTASTTRTTTTSATRTTPSPSTRTTTRTFVSVTVNNPPPPPPPYSTTPASFPVTAGATSRHPIAPPPLAARLHPAVPPVAPIRAVPLVILPAINGPPIILPPHLLEKQDVADIPLEDRWYAVMRARATGVVQGWGSVLAVTVPGRKCRVYRTPEEAWLVFMYYSQRGEVRRIS